MTMTSACGECTLCCKVIQFNLNDFEPDLNGARCKPAGKWCSFCSNDDGDRGCSLYGAATRPSSCESFECMWLRSQSLENPMSEEMRPDKLQAVPVVERGKIICYVNPSHLKAKPWKSGKLREMLGAWERAGIAVFVRCGSYEAAVTTRAIHSLRLGSRGGA